ncbi:DUF11 domain-containing protein [Streptomyces sp. NPDC059816]|uniref:DUF11 domain-containing protein n=1 Tax=Streptomyces sp. NPDC059816 TaxID=3346960 RepID=UPI00364A259E
MRRIPGRRPVRGDRRGGVTAVCCALGVGLFAFAPPVAANTADATATASRAPGAAGSSAPTPYVAPGGGTQPGTQSRAPGRADLAVRWDAAVNPSGTATGTAGAGNGGASGRPGAQGGTGSAPTGPGTGTKTPGTATTTATATDFTFTYRVSVVNHGPSRAVDVVVTDRLPDALVLVESSGGCTAVGQAITCGPLAALGVGETHTWLLTVRPADDYSGDGSDISNVAVVTSDTEDPDRANNTATHTGVPLPGGAGQADLALTKTAVLPPGRTDAVRPGDRFAYRITVRNNGPAAASGVRVADPLAAVLGFVSSPDGCAISPEDDRTVLCPVRARLAVGESVTYELLVRVREGDALRGGSGGHTDHRRCEIENTAYVTSLTRDPVPANNSNRPGTTGPGGGPLYLERPGNGPHQPEKPQKPHKPHRPHKPHKPHRPHVPDQLAETGRRVPGWLPWSGGATLATGAALVLFSRRQLRAPGRPGTPQEDTRP